MLMSILATLFATSWVGVIILIGCGFVVWFAVRVVFDTITWFREEVFDDVRASKKKSEPIHPEKDPEEDV